MSASPLTKQQQSISQLKQQSQQHFKGLKKVRDQVSSYLAAVERISREAGAVSAGRCPVLMVNNEAACSAETPDS